MSNEITLPEAQELVRALEVIIQAAVETFHNNTRLYVADIHLLATDISDMQDERPRFAYRIKVEVRL